MEIGRHIEGIAKMSDSPCLPQDIVSMTLPNNDVTLSLFNDAVTLSLSNEAVTRSLSKGAMIRSLSDEAVTLSLSKGAIPRLSDKAVTLSLSKGAQLLQNPVTLSLSKGTPKAVKSSILFFLCLFIGISLHAQPVKKYSISKGSMQIMLSKDLEDDALSDFVKQYDLGDLQIKQLIRSNFQDSVKAHGWMIEVNDKKMLVLSKPFLSSENVSVNDPANIIKFTGLGIYLGTAAPLPMSSQAFGRNNFRRQPFAVKDSVTTFLLRNNNAKEVKLAGSFTNWWDGALPMKRTDSGWALQVKLIPGKYTYKFITDGNWITDPDNAIVENDGEGNTNSVYYLTNTLFKLDGFTNAKRVYLAGSFNRWDDNQLRMNKTASGWELPLFLDSGTYTYRFRADRKWLEDPTNSNKLPNEFGEYNSVISIGKPTIFSMSGHPDAKKVFVAGSFNDWRTFELSLTKTATGWQIPYTLGSGNYEYKFFVDGKWADASGRYVQQNAPGEIMVIEPNYTFRLKGKANAKTVFVSGDFNNWSLNAYRMKKDGDDWVLQLHLSTGKHLYKYVVDDNWIIDPNNELWEQNEYNTGNSVLWIK